MRLKYTGFLYIRKVSERSAKVFELFLCRLHGLAVLWIVSSLILMICQECCLHYAF